jgi:glutathione S-transferase
VTVDDLPVLWHLKVSNYNEKARWALDYTGIPHRRRALVPGRHEPVAKSLAGGSTLPVLVIDGEAIGDSTKIIEALERRYPDPPLYPPGPIDRRRALELEDFFDEQLGAYVRLLFLHHALPDARLMLGAFTPDLRGVSRGFAQLTFPTLRPRIRSQFHIDSRAVARAYDKIRQAGSRFRSEVNPDGYLSGPGFTVADLTLAAIIAPVVAPPAFPYPQPQRDHPRLAPLREALDREGLLEWSLEMYSRHRPATAEACAPRPRRSARWFARAGNWKR